ncbi:hypothetical protein [Alteromonas sp. BMJM2]|uniref:hypothetical protein n=1 Tax=Alteromonas sp. BMJM2 TaxID=2954241 RepID=UPI0022B31481|nr:hypothetical protein [Alteromonas sp. BMJM2]
MATIPDFHSAHFTMSAENPFCLTPPSEQALYFIGVDNAVIAVNADGSVSTGYHDASSKDKKTLNDEQIPYPDPSYEAVIDALKNAAKQRTKQGAAYLSVLNSEIMLIKKSLFISVFAALVAFVVSMVCWLLVNVAIGGALYAFGISIILIAGILLCFNLGLSVLFYRIAKKSLHFVSFERLIALFKRSL